MPEPVPDRNETPFWLSPRPFLEPDLPSAADEEGE